MAAPPTDLAALRAAVARIQIKGWPPLLHSTLVVAPPLGAPCPVCRWCTPWSVLDCSPRSHVYAPHKYTASPFWTIWYCVGCEWYGAHWLRRRGRLKGSKVTAVLVRAYHYFGLPNVTGDPAQPPVVHVPP